MTDIDYARRINLAFRVCEWSDDNPFRRIAMDRLEGRGASWLGGNHAASSPATDRRIQREQTLVGRTRLTAEALSTPAAEF